MDPVIYGIGHDVSDIERIETMLQGSNGDRFLRRILTVAEIEQAALRSRTAEYVAGRFAAKEAIVKAFGCGIGHVIGFGDMEILPLPGGKPSVVLSKQAWERLELSVDDYKVHLSITHERQLASAFVVVESMR